MLWSRVAYCVVLPRRTIRRTRESRALEEIKRDADARAESRKGGACRGVVAICLRTQIVHMVLPSTYYCSVLTHTHTSQHT